MCRLRPEATIAPTTTTITTVTDHRVALVGFIHGVDATDNDLTRLIQNCPDTFFVVDVFAGWMT
jgi:hypothetical protein